MIRHVLDKFLLIFEEQAHTSSEDAVAKYIKAGQQISFADFLHGNAGTKVQVESVAAPLLNFPVCFFLNFVSHNLGMQDLKFSIELNMIS